METEKKMIALGKYSFTEKQMIALQNLGLESEHDIDLLPIEELSKVTYIGKMAIDMVIKALAARGDNSSGIT